MAIVKSTIFSVMKGKIGGLVFFNGRYGAIIVRELVIPVNPDTSEQKEARLQLTNASKSWSTDLTDLERKGWDDYAKITPYVNSVGDTVYLTGHAMYVAVRTACLGGDPTIAISQFKTACCDGGMFLDPVVDLIECDTPPECGSKLQITNNDPLLSMTGTIQISGPQNPGVKFYHGPYDPTTAQLFGPIAAGSGVEVQYCDVACEGATFFWKMRTFTSASPYKISRLHRGSFVSVCATV